MGDISIQTSAPRPQNNAGAADTRSFIDANFFIISNNCQDDPFKADVLFLAETDHTRPEMLQMQAGLLRRMIKPGDTILTESAEAFREDQLNGIPIKTKGWDNKALTNEMLEKLDRICEIDNLPQKTATDIEERNILTQRILEISEERNAGLVRNIREFSSKKTRLLSWPDQGIAITEKCCPRWKIPKKNILSFCQTLQQPQAPRKASNTPGN